MRLLVASGMAKHSRSGTQTTLLIWSTRCVTQPEEHWCSSQDQTRGYRSVSGSVTFATFSVIVLD